MSVRDKIPALEDLICQILQDYLRLRISKDSNFDFDTWKQKLYNWIENGSNSSSRATFQGAMQKIQIDGLDSYDISSMDTTILIAIHKNNQLFTKDSKNPDSIRFSLENLQTYRNYSAHRTGNEKDTDILEWAYATTYELTRLISKILLTFDNRLDEDVRRQYRYYSDKIKAIRNEFQDEYTNTLSNKAVLDNNIRMIQSTSLDNFEVFHSILNLYLYKRPFDKDSFVSFLQCAADNNIEFAYIFLAQMYFKGMYVSIDYLKAAKYYEKADLSHPQDVLNLASIYLNNICGSEKVAEGKKLLKKTQAKLKQDEIINKRISEDGYVFYFIERIRRLQT